MNRRKIYGLVVCLALVGGGNTADAISRAKLIQYASTLKGKKKAELKNAIFRCSQPQRVLGYGSGSGRTWEGFYSTDRIPGTMECVNRYSDRKFYFTNSSSVISGMNIEHSFPKSWWGGTTNNAYKDLFNLYPSETDANSKKSNYPMGKVTNPKILNDYEKVGTGPAGNLGTITLCEPNDVWKGDFCRSYFYMATIYQNLTWAGTQGLQQLENNEWPTLKEWAYKLYLEWTRKDKVLDVEVNRNNAIYEIQGNRNLFIDFPNLAEYVWGDSINVEFDPYTSITTASDDDRYMTNTIIPGDEDDGGDEDDKPGYDDGDEDSGDVDVAEGDYWWTETFSGCEGTGGVSGAWSGSVASSPANGDCGDKDGWTFTKGYVGYKCVRLGAGSSAGSAVTPEITGLKGKTFTLYFDAGAWDSASENCTLKVNATNCTLDINTVTLEKGKWNTYAITVTNVTGNVRFTFASGASSGSRFFLDNILIPREEIFDPAVNYLCWDMNKDGVISVVDLKMVIDAMNEDWEGKEWRVEDVEKVVGMIKVKR